MRVTILGGGGFRVPLICRELALSGLAVEEVVLFDVVPERLGVIADVLAGDHLPLRTTTDLDTALRGADHHTAHHTADSSVGDFRSHDPTIPDQEHIAHRA